MTSIRLLQLQFFVVKVCIVFWSMLCQLNSPTSKYRLVTDEWESLSYYAGRERVRERGGGEEISLYPDNNLCVLHIPMQ